MTHGRNPDDDDSASGRRDALRGFALAGLGGAALWPAAAGAQSTSAAWVTVKPGQSIQAALDSSPNPAVQLAPGEHRVSQPLVLPAGATLRGTGRGSRIVATQDMPALLQLHGAKDGILVEHLVLECNRRALVGLDVDLLDTTNTFFRGEPDAVCRFDNLSIYDAGSVGVWYRKRAAGTDVQACVASRVRVRNAGTYGFHIDGPDNWFIACEATTNAVADGAPNAGFLVASSNLFFLGCKAWYCRGYGYHVTSTRNKFVGCEAQDTGGHGWYITVGKNTYSACVADTAAAYLVKRAGQTADGFYVEATSNSSFVGCQSFARHADHGMQEGFSLAGDFESRGNHLIGANSWDVKRQAVMYRP